MLTVFKQEPGDDGWTCPVCRRGIAPGVKECNHGGYSMPPLPPAPWPWKPSMPFPTAPLVGDWPYFTTVGRVTT